MTEQEAKCQNWVRIVDHKGAKVATIENEIKFDTEVYPGVTNLTIPTIHRLPASTNNSCTINC